MSASLIRFPSRLWMSLQRNRHFARHRIALRRLLVLLLLLPLLKFVGNLHWQRTYGLRRIRDEATDDFLQRFVSRRDSDVDTRVAPPSLRGNRALVSHIPIDVGDGLGHRFMMLNYELMLSVHLGVGYAHRRSRYGSLSPERDPLAVDRFFGLHDYKQHRDALFNEACSNVLEYKDNCSRTNLVCVELRPRSQGGLFDSLVHVPTNISECYLSSDKQQRKLCYDTARKFGRSYPSNNTLFQTSSERCNADFRSDNWTETMSFIRAAYWNAAVPPTYEPTGVHIAVHVRRGDFKWYPKREMIPDAVYADAVCRIKRVLDREAGAEVHTTVHFFSEGLTRWKSKHDVNEQHKVYMTEKGRVAWNGHWTALLASKCERPPSVSLHIASDTIAALRDMIAADFFIGSRSGMSMAIVRILSRSILVLPNGEDSPIGHGVSNDLLRFSWSGNGSEAVMVAERLEERVAEFAQKYHYKLPLLRAL